jgi:enoyl-CoA hydratase/carnithine racemase
VVDRADPDTGRRPLSFVLDVLFCGLTLAALRYHRASNMPCWKIDKYVRRALGPNPFRAHDVIGAKGANFLTWSCLHHLSEKYGALFTPCEELEYHKATGQGWYPPDHLRPVVNWSISTEEEDSLLTWLLGPVIQMTSLMLHEQRAHLSHINAIGELCAQFRRGVAAVIRELGTEAAIRRVEAYHRLVPEAAGCCWYPETLGHIEEPAWQQLYVNAEHDGSTRVITISREGYNSDVNAEMNRALDWLKTEKIARVIVTGDFHLSTQMTGADTADFFPALNDAARGTALSLAWSKTARRLHDEFAVSVGFIYGKRCLGGMLELMMHCHYLIAQEDSLLGMPEVTLPVIPGMEGCHWPLRKAQLQERGRILHWLLTGESVRAQEAGGWLVDFSGPLERCLQKAWELVTSGNRSLPARPVVERGLDIHIDEDLPPAQDALMEAARHAVIDCIRESCGVSLHEALTVQAQHSGAFMAGKLCRSGAIGSKATKILSV